MAGHNIATIRPDPALTKWNNMSINRYKYFRWTPRTAWLNFIYVGVVPAAVLYVAYTTDGKHEFRGKLRGNTIAEW